MTASDHVKALLDHSGPGWWICACATPRRCAPAWWSGYREEDAAPIVVDRAAIEALGVRRHRPLASETLLRPPLLARLAEAVMELYMSGRHQVFLRKEGHYVVFL